MGFIMPKLISRRPALFFFGLTLVSWLASASAQNIAQSPQRVSDKLADRLVNRESTTSTTSTANPRSPEVTFFSGSAPQSIEELRSMEAKFAEVAEMVKPATVNIQMGAAQGSGVVVTSDGYILTAAHVIGRPNGNATVTFPDGKKVKATTLGVETGIDSGMLKINEDQGDDFPYLELGLSDELEPGQWVMAVGHPGGIDEARGLVVRVGRLIFGSSRVLRTDCTLVGGDSGGPLVDMNGDVIGIHSRIGAQLWNNLHVPVDTYSENWDRLAQGIVLDGRASLGFSVVDDTNKIDEVVDDGPAASAGIKNGDVIKKLGQIDIEDREDLRDAVTGLRPNMKVEMVIERDGEEKTFELVVGQ
jgi:serine protease Do